MRGERGSGSVLAALIVLLAALAFCVLVVFGGGVAALHRARSTADLAALGGAVALAEGQDACAGAAVVAARNGASLEECVVGADRVDVVVAVELGSGSPLLPRAVGAGASAEVG